MCVCARMRTHTHSFRNKYLKIILQFMGSTERAASEFGVLLTLLAACDILEADSLLSRC